MRDWKESGNGSEFVRRVPFLLYPMNIAVSVSYTPDMGDTLHAGLHTGLA